MDDVLMPAGCLFVSVCGIANDPSLNVCSEERVEVTRGRKVSEGAFFSGPEVVL